MNDIVNLKAAKEDVPPDGVVPCQKEAIPEIVIDTPKVVVLKGSGPGKAHRLKVTLKTKTKSGKAITFDGEGELSWNPADKIKIFSSKNGKNELPAPIKVKGPSMKSGKRFWIEAKDKSAALDDVTLELKLVKKGTLNVGAPNPAKDKLTCLKVQLEVCHPRSAAGTDPTPLDQAKKYDPGRYIHLQRKKLWAGRAMVIIKKAEPAAFDGDLTLEAVGNHVRLFASDKEVAASGQAELKLPLKESNLHIPNTGKKYWAEGVKTSKDLHDTGFKLFLKGLKYKPEGDRIGITVMQLDLDICGAKKGKSDPAPFKEDKKLDPGRVVQLQDAGKHAARALIIVHKAKPLAFNGKISLIPMDNRVGIYDTETGGALKAAAGTPIEIDNSTIDKKKGQHLWVEGLQVSNALKDSGFRIKLKDAQDNEHVSNDGDKVVVTVAEFTKLKATIKPTPPITVRAGFAAPAKHDFETTSIDPDFAANKPLVLLRNASDDIELKVTVKPNGLPILWDTPRNKDDHASLGGKNSKPGITPDGADATKAKLKTDNKGSFRVRPFIDSNGENKYSEGEPSIPINLVLVDATVNRDKSKARTKNLNVNTATNRIVNGAWGPAPLTAATLKAAGMAMELFADVKGGGADGRLGLDQVFAGLVNNVTIRDVKYHFRDTTVAHPTNHQVRLIAASNKASATGGGGSYFTAGDPAPALYTLPLLDAGGSASPGTGGDSACMSRSVGTPAKRTNRTVGQRWRIRCIDSPGTPFFRTHFDNPNAVIQKVDYHYEFQATFCFWTNTDKNRGPTGKPTDRLYSVLRYYKWRIKANWNVTWPSPGSATFTVVTKHTIKNFNKKTYRPISKAKNVIEVRPPSGIHAGLIWDAQ